MKRLLNDFDQATARIEQIIFIAGAIGDGFSISSPLHDLIQDTSDTELKEIFGDIPKHLSDEFDSRNGAEAFAEFAHLYNKLGFCVEFSTPVMKRTSATSQTYSWGHFYSKWIYAETFEDALKKGFEWVAEKRLAEEKKSEVKHG